MHEKFEVVFEDKNVLVLNKPAGLLSQGDISESENLVDLLRIYFGRHYVGLVHRLDRNTSGLMVVAKRSKAAQRLTDQLQAGELKRAYGALLTGHLTAPQTWKHFLVKDEARNLVRVGQVNEPGAKAAVLRVTPISIGGSGPNQLTWARLELETGRSHQIRVQAQVSGYPLLGDTKYGAGATVTDQPIRFDRPALHSADLTFEHPIDKTKLRFEAPPPRDIQDVLNRLSFRPVGAEPTKAK